MQVLAFDLGTTNLKACLVDETGRTLASARRATPIQRPRDGWRECAPDALIAAIAELALEIRNAAPHAEIKALTFVSQANSFLLLDEAGAPVTPIILWSDQRAVLQDPRLTAIAHQPDFRAQTGVPDLNSDFMLAKLLWIERHQPAEWRRARRLCQISDYLLRQLTGDHVTEAGLAGLTGLADIHQLAWRQTALEAAGLSRIALPRIVRAGTVIGPVHAASAKQFNLPGLPLLVIGCLDQYAGAIGAGCIEPEMPCEMTGTVLATAVLHAEGKCDKAGVFVGPAFQPGLYWHMCFGNVSANLLEVFRDEQPDNPTFGQLDAEAAAVRDGGPQLDLTNSAQQRRAVFVDVLPRHQRGHHARSILEGVAQALRDQLIALGTPVPTCIRAVGSAAGSDLWLQLKANMLGVPVEAMACAEPACLGGAILAAAGLGHLSIPDQVRSWTTPRRRFLPQENRSSLKPPE